MKRLIHSSRDLLAVGAVFTYQLCHVYRDKILTRVIKRKMHQPWMRHKEIGIIQEILKNLQPEKCLEWGAGYSTLYFPKFLSKNARWVCLEHDKDWITKIEKKTKQNPNVEVFYILPDHFPWTDEYKDGAYSDLSSYVEFPNSLGDFDFILIDGRARKECLMKAYQLLRSRGVVVLHDANRKYYHGPFELYESWVLFEDHRKFGAYLKCEGGLWVGSKETDLGFVLDVDKHRKVWRIYEKIGTALRR